MRELKNAIRSAALYGGSNIEPAHLSFVQRSRKDGKDSAGNVSSNVDRIMESGVDLKELVREYERRIAMEVIAKLKGDKKEAARLLGLHYTTLLDKLR